jgi:hypothetical protein
VSIKNDTLFNLFVVHSGITEIIADLTVEYLGLNSADTAALSFRGDFQVRGIPTLRVADVAKANGARNRWAAARQNVRDCDDAIEQQVQGRHFRLFVPHLAAPPYRYLSAHPLCSEIAYIEEGTTSYFQAPGTGRINPLKPSTAYRVIHDLLLYGPVRRFGIVCLYSEDFYPNWQASSFYFVGACAFPWARFRFQLNPGSLVDEWDGPGHILAVDRLRASGAESPEQQEVPGVPSAPQWADEGVPVTDYLRALDRLLTVLVGKGVDALAFKFHPIEQDAYADQVRDLLQTRRGVRVTELDRTFSIERNCRDRHVYSVTSSASHYANLFGGVGHSFKDFLDPAVRRELRSDTGPYAPASLVFGREFPPI